MYKAQTPNVRGEQDSGLLVAEEDCIVWLSAGDSQ